jgi:putative copper resistance protein D
VTIEAGLILSRFLHYSCVLAIFGISLFPIYTQTDSPFLSHEFRRWRQKALLISTGVGIVSAIAWFVFTAAVMADGFLAALDMSTFESVIEDTSFGKVWVLRVLLLLCLFALLAFARRPGKQQPRLHLALASVIAGSLAAVGHTRTHEGPLKAIHALSDSLHLLAAGAWLGGLLALGFIVHASCKNPFRGLEDLGRTLVEFSSMGTAAVGVLLASGLANTLLLVRPLSGLTEGPYGQLLLLKIVLFGAMLTLAAQNRFVLTPMLTETQEPMRNANIVRRLHRNIIAEQTLGALILGAVAVLGTISPGPPSL